MASYEEVLTLDDVKASIDGSNLSDEIKAKIDAIDSVDKVDLQEGALTGAAGDGKEAVLISAGASGNYDLGDATAVVVGNSSAALTSDNANALTVSIDGGTTSLTIDNSAKNVVDLTNGTNNAGVVDVTTGAGEDTFNIVGPVNANVSSGAGDDMFVLDGNAQEQAKLSVDAGDGFDEVMLHGDIAEGHAFSFGSDGKFHMNSADVTLDGVEVVARDVDGDGKIVKGTDHVTFLAADEFDGTVASLYKVVLGREAIDETTDSLEGYKHWTNAFKAQVGGDRAQAIEASLNSDEASGLKAMDNAGFVATLLANAGAKADVTANAGTYIAGLNDGSMSRADVVANVIDAMEDAAGDDNVSLVGSDGVAYVVMGY